MQASLSKHARGQQIINKFARNHIELNRYQLGTLVIAIRMAIESMLGLVFHPTVVAAKRSHLHLLNIDSPCHTNNPSVQVFIFKRVVEPETNPVSAAPPCQLLHAV